MENLTMSEQAPSGGNAERPQETPEEKKARKEAEKKKKAEEKARKQKEQAERVAQRGQKAALLNAPDPSDPHGSHYGDSELVQSKERTDTIWTPVHVLDASKEGQTVRVRARLHTTRGKGKSCFMVLRERIATVQCTVFANEDDGGQVSKFMAKYAQQIPKESIVDVMAKVVCPPEPVAGCTQSDIELQVSDIHVISRAAALPFELADAARPRAEIAAAIEAGEVLATVEQDTRLNVRYLDLRTPANQAIFRLQSGVCQHFRASLLRQGFQEIHTPKMIGGSSEGGSEVFQFDYFGQAACLAQSPQLYKQMAICADFGRVFEIGPVFRAENSFTHRHMCEFTGLDFEMEIKEHYAEVMDVIETMFRDIFGGLEREYATELATLAQQYPFEPFVMRPMRFTFAEGIKMLQEYVDEATGERPHAGASPLEDIGTEQEKLLGRLIKARHGTDFYMLTEFPLAVRPFYTMPCPHNPDLSNSFDVFMRGEEIISGAQRIHTPELLEKRAVHWGIPPESIRPYLTSFSLGAPPHGGCGVGMERVVMLYLGLGNIRLTSMFPRDPKRLTP